MTIQSRLQNCKQVLRTWRANIKREVQRNMKLKMRQLSNLHNVEQGKHTEANKKIQEALLNKLADDELKWKQRAKQYWL